MSLSCSASHTVNDGDIVMVDVGEEAVNDTQDVINAAAKPRMSQNFSTRPSLDISGPSYPRRL